MKISITAVAHDEDATLHLNYKVSTTVLKHGNGSCAQTKAYLTNEKHRPLTDDDGVKQCFSVTKITSKRVPRYVSMRE